MDKFETSDEKRFTRYVKDQGSLSLKLNILGRNGWPDRLILGMNRLILFIEFKRKGKGAEKKQSLIHRILRRFGHVIHTCDNYEKAKEVYDKEVRSKKSSKERN